jgi:hypothetical protein
LRGRLAFRGVFAGPTAIIGARAVELPADLSAVSLLRRGRQRRRLCRGLGRRLADEGRPSRNCQKLRNDATCEVTLKGSLTGKTQFGAGGEFGTHQPFVSVATIELQHPSPVGGTLTVTDSADSAAKLELVFSSQGCQPSANDIGLLLQATWQTASSTHRFKGAGGVGTLNDYYPTGLTEPKKAGVEFSLFIDGNLHFGGVVP